MTTIDDILARLTGNYDKAATSNNAKLLGIPAAQVDVVQSVVDRVALWRDIAEARGKTLDAIGSNVGVGRSGYSDVVYRKLIYAQIAINTTSGELEFMNTILSRLMGDAYVSTHEVLPAGVLVTYRNSPLFEALMDEFLETESDVYLFDGFYRCDGEITFSSRDGAIDVISRIFETILLIQTLAQRAAAGGVGVQFSALEETGAAVSVTHDVRLGLANLVEAPVSVTHEVTVITYGYGTQKFGTTPFGGASV